MTRSRIQRTKSFAVLLIFLLFQVSTSDSGFRERRVSDDKQAVPSEIKPKDGHVKARVLKNEDKPPEPSVHLDQKNGAAGSANKTANVTTKHLLSQTPAATSPSAVQSPSGMHVPSMNTGAFYRGMFVIFGLSVIVMAYMVFRSFRLNKPPTQMVRKYGVLAHRQDVEMRPLPLDEDDEDDTTVFDASSITSQRIQT